MQVNQKICDDIYTEGEVTNVELFTCDGIIVRQYTVIYCGEKYLLTSHNHEWVYLWHQINVD